MSVLLHVSASLWVTELEDQHDISKRRLPVTQRRGATFQKDEDLNIIDVRDIRLTNTHFIVTLILCFQAVLKSLRT
jgi:hypothetical protein